MATSIHVSKSPNRFFKTISLGRYESRGFRYSDIINPNAPRYGQKSMISHKRFSHIDPDRKFY